jgi:hypothetical protein
MTTPNLASILLGSTAPERLRNWYADVLGAALDTDGWLHFGPVAVKIERREDVAQTTSEPGRVIFNYHVADIHGSARRLDEHGARWIAGVDYRPAQRFMFATCRILTETTFRSSSSPTSTGRADVPATQGRHWHGPA